MPHRMHRVRRCGPAYCYGCSVACVSVCSFVCLLDNGHNCDSYKKAEPIEVPPLIIYVMLSDVKLQYLT